MSDQADQLLFDRIYDVIEDGDDLTHEHVAEQILQRAMEYRAGCEQAVRDDLGAAAASLAAFRAHPDYKSILGNIVCDLQDGLDDSEAYEGESDARREGYQLLHVLLEGKRWEPAARVSEPDEDVPALRLVTP